MKYFLIFSLLLFFADLALSRNMTPCFLAGYQGYKINGGNCDITFLGSNQSLQGNRDNDPYFKYYYVNCPIGEILCNNIIFKNICVRFDQTDDLNKKCLERADPSKQAKAILSNPLLKYNFNQYLESYKSHCDWNIEGGPISGCSEMSKYLIEIKDELIIQSGGICIADAEGHLSIGNPSIDALLNLIAGFEIPYYFEEYQDLYNSLNATEKKMFQNFLKLGGDPKSFFHANCFLKKYKDRKFAMSGSSGQLSLKSPGKEGEGCNFLINDYTKPSTTKRLFTLNRCTSEVTVMASAHGKGKGKQTNNKTDGTYFSNTPDSNASPTGFFIVGRLYDNSKTWSPGIKLHGLQKPNKAENFEGNDNTYRRGVVLHRNGGCDGRIANSSEVNPPLEDNPCSNTIGCLGVPWNNWENILKTVVGERVSGSSDEVGSLLYTYGPFQKEQDLNYCGGDEQWLQ